MLSRLQAIEKLQAAWDQLERRYDLNANRVGSGAKGGRSRPGAAFDYYVSYKDTKGQNLGLAAYYKRSGDPVTFEVSLRDTSVRPARVVNTRDFDESDFTAAHQDFERQLSGLNGVRRR